MPTVQGFGPSRDIPLRPDLLALFGLRDIWRHRTIGTADNRSRREEIAEAIAKDHDDWVIIYPKPREFPVFHVLSHDGCHARIDNHWFSLEGATEARRQIDEIFEAQRKLIQEN